MPLTADQAAFRVKQLLVTFPDLGPDETLQITYFPNKAGPAWQQKGQERTQRTRARQREAQEAQERGEIPPDQPVELDGTVEDLLEVLHGWDFYLTDADKAANNPAPITAESMYKLGYDILLRISAAILSDIQPDPTEFRRRSGRASGFGQSNVRARVLPPIESESATKPDPVTTTGASMSGSS